MSKTSTKQILAAALLALAGGAQAQIINNGDFAQGLTGWGSAGDVGVLSGNLLLGTESRFGSAAWINELAPLVGKVATDFDLPDLGEAVEGSIAWQSFSAAAGSTLSFDWQFGSADEYEGDYAFVMVDGQISLLGSLASATTPVPGVGMSTGWQSFSLQLSGSGNHQVAFGVLDLVDVSGESGLALRNVQVTAVPEPSTWLMSLAGLAAIGALARRRKPADAAAAATA